MPNGRIIRTDDIETYGSTHFNLVDWDIALDIKSFLESGGNVTRSGRLQWSRTESFALRSASLVDRGLLRLPGRGSELFSQRGGPLRIHR